MNTTSFFRNNYTVPVMAMVLLCCATAANAMTAPDTSADIKQLIFKLKPEGLEQLPKLEGSLGMKIKPVFAHTTSSSVLNLWFVARMAGPVGQAIKHLQDHPAIAIVGFNQALQPTAVLPDDPMLNKQWADINPDNLWQQTHPAVSAAEAWEIETGTEDVIIAVLDTGVDYTHEDLRDNMWVNEVEANGLDNVDDDANGCVDDVYGCDFRSNVREKLGYYPGLGGAYYKKEKYMRPDGMGHGTMVAGVLGAVGNNGVGIAGVNWKTRIMAVKFINQNNAANMLDAALSIQYAVDNGAKIINNSYGRQTIEGETAQIIEDAIQYANDNGVLMIASAGNSGVDIDNSNHFFPADSTAANLITVTALNPDDTLWDHANYGVYSVDIAAPGASVLTTVPAGHTSLFRKYYDPSGYMKTEGTSIATPYVSGVAALLFSRYPGISHHEVKRIILDSASKLPALAGKTVTGGRVNAYNALTGTF